MRSCRVHVMPNRPAPQLQRRLLDCYEAVAVATRRMLDAARAADWRSVHDSGLDCDTWMQHIEALPAAEAVLDADGRKRRVEILRDVLRADAALRDLLQPSLARLDDCLGRDGSARLRP